MLRSPRVWMFTAGGWLLVCAAAHGIAHVWLFVLENEFYGMREFAMNAMKQADSFDPLRPSMWRHFRMFSMSFALLFGFAGIVDLLIAGTRTQNVTVRTFALWGTLFWTLVFGLLVFVEPVLQAILASAVAVSLHAIAFVTADQAIGSGPAD